MSPGVFIFLAFLIVIIVLIARNVHTVEQDEAWVIQRFGEFQEIWRSGLHIQTPFVETVRAKVSLREQTIDIPPSPVITKDNATVEIDTIIYYQITDPKLYAYNIRDPEKAMQNLTITTLRNVIGGMDLNQSLNGRDMINTRMRSQVDEATDPWGIKVNRVEIQSITPNADTKEAMEKLVRAERERASAITKAEGQKQSQIKVAEGEQRAAVLRADAAKQVAILEAEGKRQARILEAEAEAQAILAVQKALADSLRMLNEAAPNDQVVKLKALETMEKVAQGQATKIIIPSELQGLAGLAAGAKTVWDTPDPKNPNLPG